MILYDHPASGNCKARILLRQLELPYAQPGFANDLEPPAQASARPV